MNVYEHFACYTVLPIRLDDIRQHIIETGVVDSIQFVGVDLDPTIVAGFLRVSKWKPPHGAYGTHATIFYSTRLEEAMRRLVICKEMLHILDSHQATAQTHEEVSRLIVELGAPITLTMSIPGVSDHIGSYMALSVLLPRDALHALRDHVKSGRLSIEAIANLARVPQQFVSFMLSRLWRDVVEEAYPDNTPPRPAMERR